MPKKTALAAAIVLIVISIYFIPKAITKYEKSLEIDEMIAPSINGIDQMLLIRSKNRGFPVLLYLNGGPGQSVIPFAHVATKDLIKTLTVVYWDQRGTGLSYSDDIPRNTMTIGQFIDDAKKVTEYLKNRFHKNKIYLLGHSWGSVLGTLVVKDDPGSYYAYIGVGQVISQASVTMERIRWLEQKIGSNDPDDLDELNRMKANIYNFSIHNGYYLIDKYGGATHSLDGHRMGEIMASSPYKPEKYTSDLYDKGLMFSLPIAKEAYQHDFSKDALELNVPVYFFLGRYDYVTPAKPVEDYYELLKAPKKKIIWFENSGHHMDIEEPDKFQNEILKIYRENR